MIEFIKKVIGDKKEYHQMTARIKALPDDYRYVYEQIQTYMWSFVAGTGDDILKVQYELIDLFESGAANGKPVLSVTGEDVAAFCDDLLSTVKTSTGKRREALNRNIMKKVGKNR